MGKEQEQFSHGLTVPLHVIVAGLAMTLLLVLPAHSQSWTASGGNLYTTANVGIGTSSPEQPLQVQGGGLNVFTYLDVRNYTTSAGYPPGLNISASNSNTLGVLAATVNGQYLTEWSFRGVDSSSSAFRQAAIMDVFQDGAAQPTRVPGMFQFMTSDGTAGPVPRLVIKANGNVGIGTTSPAAALDVNGSINVSGNIAAKYQDIAEWVPSEGELPNATVVVLSSDHVNRVEESLKSYDTRVAGVVSERPGMILGEQSSDKAKIATTGRVKVKVDATKHPVRIGDLLVTSDTPGYAMCSQPVDLGGVAIHRPGTIIGKALEPLAEGRGEILVLLSLQ